jgi:hypothetical protein
MTIKIIEIKIKKNLFFTERCYWKKINWTKDKKNNQKDDDQI